MGGQITERKTLRRHRKHGAHHVTRTRGISINFHARLLKHSKISDEAVAWVSVAKKQETAKFENLLFGGDKNLLFMAGRRSFGDWFRDWRRGGPAQEPDIKPWKGPQIRPDKDWQPPEGQKPLRDLPERLEPSDKPAREKPIERAKADPTSERGIPPYSGPSWMQPPAYLRPSDELMREAITNGITGKVLWRATTEGAGKGLKAYAVVSGASAVVAGAVGLALTAPAWAPPVAALGAVAGIGLLYNKIQNTPSNDKNMV